MRLPFKLLIHILIIFSPCILSVVLAHYSESPSSSPSLPLEPQLLSFLDQRLAVVYPIIQTFKNTITSDPRGITQTWVGPNICNYKGFFCDNPPDNLTAIAVASIDFNGFQLGAPSLDGFIDQLPDIALFHANSNNFSGTISPNIAKLPFLYELDISNNFFSGTFPTAVLAVKGLSFLDIRFNSFSGSAPPEIFIQTFDILFINNNNFTQKLPESIGSTSALYLTLANNRFTGPIPRSIGNASSALIEVLFLNNLLTGCLPYEIGFLSKATVFDAANNLLTGPLPCSLGCLDRIEQLNFANNFLYGQVPEVVCSLGNLVNFSLSNNYFTKVGPLCRKMIKSGVLDLRKNCVPDLPEQRSVKECVLFFLHPRYCPYPLASFGLVPCKGVPLSPMDRFGKREKRSSVTYAALSRHKL